MEIQVDIDLIRFDVKKDYLPYAHKQKVQLNEEMCLSELYGVLARNVVDFGYDNKKVECLINGVLVHQDVLIGELCQRFGYEWRLEAFAPQAVLQDLIVNWSLIASCVKEVEEVCPLSGKDYALFEKLLPLCFLTPISKTIEGYLGEGFFIFVCILARTYPQHSTNLFRLISSPYNGVMNAIPLRGRVFPELSTYDQEIFAAQRAIMSGYPLYDTAWIEYTKSLKEEFL